MRAPLLGSCRARCSSRRRRRRGAGAEQAPQTTRLVAERPLEAAQDAGTEQGGASFTRTMTRPADATTTGRGEFDARRRAATSTSGAPSAWDPFGEHGDGLRRSRSSTCVPGGRSKASRRQEWIKFDLAELGTRRGFDLAAADAAPGTDPSRRRSNYFAARGGRRPAGRRGRSRRRDDALPGGSSTSRAGSSIASRRRRSTAHRAERQARDPGRGLDRRATGSTRRMYEQTIEGDGRSTMI